MLVQLVLISLKKFQNFYKKKKIKHNVLNAKQHDKEAKIRQVKNFLGEGSKVKLTVMFRGREIARPDRGVSLLRSVAEEVKDYAKGDSPPSMEGRRINVVLSPVSAKSKTNKTAREVPSKESDEGEEKNEDENP